MKIRNNLMMKKIKTQEIMAAPSYYKKFQCAASKCKDTCCQSWQISIDRRSWRKYLYLIRKERKQNRNDWNDKKTRQWIQKGLDFRTHSFAMKDGKCVFLDRDSLCRLQRIWGAELLCNICRRYPRHMEVYDGLKEFSLSLSCPEAARMILTEKENLHLDLDYVKKTRNAMRKRASKKRCQDREVFLMLLKIRKNFFLILQNQSLSVKDRIIEILEITEKIQTALERGKDCLKREITEYEKNKKRKEILKKNPKNDLSEMKKKEQRYIFMSSCCEVFEQLEPIQNKWKKQMQKEWKTLYVGGLNEYERKRADFQKENTERISEKFLMYFLYVYFLGGVYDGQIETKVKFAILSWLVVREWAIARKEKMGKILLDDWIELSSHYSREIEHSEENLEMIEKMIEKHSMFQKNNIFAAL